MARYYVIRHSDDEDEDPNIVVACETDADGVQLLRDVLPALQNGTRPGAKLIIAREVD
jgi:hypothetical protein